MTRPLHEQVVVITGASSGIGRETALKFAKAGAAVVLAARNEQALDELASELRAQAARVHVVPTDVSIWEQVQHLADEAVATFGRVDTWVNNAGSSIYAYVKDTTVEEARRLMDVNFMSQVYGVKAVLPHMQRQSSGTIINIGSVLSTRSVPYQAVYCASKHAVRGFTESLRMELEHEKSGINVTLVMPASINTPLFNHARSKLGVKPLPIPPIYDPAIVSDSIVYAARHPQRDIYAGGAGWFFAIMQRISPALTDRMMLTGGAMFRLQRTNEPDDGRDNLDQPMTGSGRIQGDFSHLAKPSLFTRFAELMPLWQRALVPAVAVGAVSLVRRLKAQRSRRNWWERALG